MKVGLLQHQRGLLSDQDLLDRKRKCSEFAKDLVSCFKFEFIWISASVAENISSLFLKNLIAPTRPHIKAYSKQNHPTGWPQTDLPIAQGYRCQPSSSAATAVDVTALLERPWLDVFYENTIYDFIQILSISTLALASQFASHCMILSSSSSYFTFSLSYSKVNLHGDIFMPQFFFLSKLQLGNLRSDFNVKLCLTWDLPVPCHENLRWSVLRTSKREGSK